MKIHVNQLGYFPTDQKIIVFSSETKEVEEKINPIQIKDTEGHFTKEITPVFYGWDENAGDWIWHADISDVQEGTYQIEGNDGTVSHVFHIGNQLYTPLNQLLCKAFYFQRCGTALEVENAGIFARASCHEEKAILLEDYQAMLAGEVALKNIPLFDVQGGWHDAGDYGRYTTAAATSLAHLLYAFKFFSCAFSESLNLPESENILPDILNECMYELRWLFKMQLSSGGVCHKLTSMRHANFVMPAEDHRQFLLFPVSSVATASFSAIMALASRIYAPYDETFSQEALLASQNAWNWLTEHPYNVEFHNPEGCNTGEYDDGNDQDERLWASIELFLAIKDESYLKKSLVYLENSTSKEDFGWDNVAGIAGMALLENQISSAQKKPLNETHDKLTSFFQSLFIEKADERVEKMKKSGYFVSLDKHEYGWGSNMVLAKHSMLFSLVFLLTKEQKYYDAVAHQIDYLLGLNPLGLSYITGVGTEFCKHPHNRVTVADGIEQTIPGFVSGGPNAHPVDEKAEWLIAPGTPPMKSFLDIWECYSLNEITIYWNSPVIFTVAFLSSQNRKEEH